MKKGAKGKKGKKIVTDLDSFNAPETAPIKTSEKDIDHKTAAPTKANSGAAAVEVNRNEEEVNKFNASTIEFTMSSFYYALDNKFVDTYFANRVDIFCEDEKDILQAEEFLHFIRFMNRDLEFILSLKFSSFWGLISKNPEISRFLDEFLQSMRKHNDTFKLQHISQYHSVQIHQSGPEKTI